MSDIMKRRDELEQRIADLFVEFDDVLSPMGDYLYAVERGTVDQWTAEDIAEAEKTTELFCAGWVLVATYDLLMSSHTGSFVHSFTPKRQNTLLTSGLGAWAGK